MKNYKPLISAANPLLPQKSKQPTQAVLQRKTPISQQGCKPATVQAKSQRPQYTLVSPIPRGNGIQRIKATLNKSSTPIGSVDIRPLSGGKLELFNLNVMQQHRRRGVGTMLMNAALRNARSQGLTASLEARPSDDSISRQALVGMYQKMGFRNVGISVRGNPLMVHGSGALRPKTMNSIKPGLSGVTIQRFKAKSATIQMMESISSSSSKLKKSNASQLLEILNSTRTRVMGLFWVGKANVAGVLERIRKDYFIGTSEEYEVLEQSDWEAKAKQKGYQNAKFESGKHGATVGGFYSSTGCKPLVTIETAFIETCLSQGKVWDIVQVLKHEYQHVKQANSRAYPDKYRIVSKENEALSEFEACVVEIKECLRRLSRKGLKEYEKKSSLSLLISAVTLAMRSHMYNLSFEAQRRLEEDIWLVKAVSKRMHDPQALYRFACKMFAHHERQDIMQSINDLAFGSQDIEDTLSIEFGITQCLDLEVKTYHELKKIKSKLK